MRGTVVFKMNSVNLFSFFIVLCFSAFKIGSTTYLDLLVCSALKIVINQFLQRSVNCNICNVFTFLLCSFVYYIKV